MNSYNEAKKIFETTRKRKLANNTYLVKTTHGFGVKLHQTVVLEYLPNNTIRLDTGGWHTRTTHARMSSYLPEGISVSGGTSRYYKAADRYPSIIQFRELKAGTNKDMIELLRVDDYEFSEWRYQTLKDGCIIELKDNFVDYTKPIKNFNWRN